MAITVIASSNADPLNNPTDDLTIQLSNEPPIVTPASLGAQPLYGYAADSTDGSPVWVWSWSIIAAPDNSTAAIAASNVQNISVQNFNQWGNLRLFLVATNTNNGQTSETDPLKAPSSAFVTIKVRSPKRSIQKMAAGERNWMGAAWEWAQAIENMDTGLPPHNIIDHLDVVDATGADLENLTGGGYAIDPDGTNAANPQGYSILHKHYGSDVDAASTSSLGVVKLSDAPSDPLNPVVLNKERIVWTSKSEATLNKAGLVTGIVDQLSSASHPFSTMHAIFRNPYDNIAIEQFSVAFLNGGQASPSTWGVKIFTCPDIAALEANTWSPLQTNSGADVEITKAQTIDYKPLAFEAAKSPAWNTLGRGWIGIQLSRVPAGRTAYGMNVSLIGIKEG